jgi:dimethylargininase
MPRIALVRRPPRSYLAFYAAHGIQIDARATDQQHAAYVEALIRAGLEVESIVPDERFPDGVFIEDTAVVWDGRALRTRMALHREGEQAGVFEHLSRTHEIESMPAGATLDGGDVLHAGDVTYVGRSARTNAAGAAALRKFLGPVRPVIEIPVTKCLHLKTAATWLGNGTLLIAPDLVDTGLFGHEELLLTPTGESLAANTLRAGRHLLTLAGFPGTHAALSRFAGEHDLELQALEMTEFQKGDGSLTCLSILM